MPAARDQTDEADVGRDEAEKTTSESLLPVRPAAGSASPVRGSLSRVTSSTRERGFREGAMVSSDTCLFVKNWTFLVVGQWRRNWWFRTASFLPPRVSIKLQRVRKTVDFSPQTYVFFGRRIVELEGLLCALDTDFISFRFACSNSDCTENLCKKKRERVRRGEKQSRY